MPLEYSNEEQAICAVALVKPRPEVFAAAIQQLLVVCTTTEVHIQGRQVLAHRKSEPALSAGHLPACQPGTQTFADINVPPYLKDGMT